MVSYIFDGILILVVLVLYHLVRLIHKVLNLLYIIMLLSYYQ